MELSGFILPFQFMDFVTLGPELQSKFNIPRVYFHYLYPLALTLAIAISSHMKLLSACQGNPGFFPAYSHERGGVAESDHLEGAFSGTDDFSYTETDL